MQLTTTTIDLEGVGPVSFEPSRRAKALNITVRPPGRIRVAVPQGMSITRALAFARSKKAWLKARLKDIRRLETIHRDLLAKEARLDHRQVREALVRRLTELARQNGFSFNRVAVRRQKTRWGSCSAGDDISLNMRLVLLPDPLRDYVLLHELMHTRFRHHGPSFWTALDSLVGNARKIDRQLRSYRILLI